MHTAIKIYNGLIEPHVDYCSAVWDGLTQQLGEKLQKTSKLCHQSYNFQAMIRVLDIFLTHLVGTIYRLGGLKKKASLKYKCVNNLAPAYICNLFCPKNTELLISKRQEKIDAPKTKN